MIELLVVVAIIALLVSILLPALSQAKRLANVTICATNERALTQAMFLYAQDCDGQLPYYGGDKSLPGYWDQVRWHQKIEGYTGISRQQEKMRDRGLYKCPLIVDIPMPLRRNSPGDEHFARCQYGMNTYFRGKCEPHKAKEGETGWEQAGFLPTGQVRIDRLRSDNVLIGPCTLWGTDNGTWYAGPVISHTLSGSRWGDNKRMAQPPWPVDPMFVAVEDEPGKVWGHEGKVNLANIDGSVSVETFWDERVMERRFLPPAIYHREH